MSDRLPLIYLSINLSFVKLFYISPETVLPSIPHSSVTSIRLASAVQILAQAPYRGSYRVFGPVRNYRKTKQRRAICICNGEKVHCRYQVCT